MVFIRHIEVAFLFVQLVDALHLVVGKGEVEGLDVFVDIVRIRGTRDDREAHLHVSPNDDLCGTLAMSLGNLADDGVAQQFTL